ncbi:hypothetical protein N7492_004214 [Penicillium capsulatum]|uniref:Uncharacterized protein n=1 Tax=Penicillium capsulatum TaxID=69766 RepID=A0A9W9I7G0_9EURO|nr:hypothetical protein N7492_004214 [Penicillium capsulatum]
MHGVSDSNRGRRVCVEREADTPRRGRPGGCGARGALGRGRSAAQGGRPGSPGRGAGPAAPRHGRGGRPVGGAAMGAWAGGRGRRVGEGVTAGRWRAARGRQFAAGHGGGTGGRGQACRGLGGGWGHPGEGGTRRVRARRFASSQRAVGGGHTGGGALGAGHAHGGSAVGPPGPPSEIYILAHTYSPVDTPPIVRPTRVPEIYLDPSRSAHALSGQPRGGGAAPAPARPAMPRGGPFGGGHFWALSCMHGVSNSKHGRRVCVEARVTSSRHTRAVSFRTGFPGVCVGPARRSLPPVEGGPSAPVSRREHRSSPPISEARLAKRTGGGSHIRRPGFSQAHRWDLERRGPRRAAGGDGTPPRRGEVRPPGSAPNQPEYFPYLIERLSGAGVRAPLGPPPAPGVLTRRAPRRRRPSPGAGGRPRWPKPGDREVPGADGVCGRMAAGHA